MNQKFLQDVLIPWIGELSSGDPEATECGPGRAGERQKFSEHIVDLMLMVYRLGSAEDKISLLSQQCKVLSLVYNFLYQNIYSN